MDKKSLKEITYSSEYVAELENKLEYLKGENSEPTLIQGVLNNCKVVESDL